jgi:hypothetical protein
VPPRDGGGMRHKMARRPDRGSRDLTPGQRKPLKEFVFTGKRGNPAPFLAKR